MSIVRSSGLLCHIHLAFHIDPDSIHHELLFMMICTALLGLHVPRREVFHILLAANFSVGAFLPRCRIGIVTINNIRVTIVDKAIHNIFLSRFGCGSDVRIFLGRS